MILEGIKPSLTWLCIKFRSGRVYPRQILFNVLPWDIEIESRLGHLGDEQGLS